MKTIGLIGGMSWESSAVYYQLLNQQVREQLGGQHSCACLLYSVDFAEIAELQHQNRWDLLSLRMVEAAQRLEFGGADLIVLCTNTMHKLAETIEQSIKVPFVHIVDATGDAVRQRSCHKVGLLGTKFMMEEPFFKDRLQHRFSVETLIPTEADRAVIHRVIYEELVQGVIQDASRQQYVQIMKRLVAAGAEGIILGCTEIGLLITQADCSVPIFDTTHLHARSAVGLALSTI